MTKKIIISRYIWLKIISRTWEPGTPIPSANSLALHLNQSSSSVKLALQSFILNKIVICKTGGKCKINPDLYSYFPFSISDKYNAECINAEWSEYEGDYILRKKYKQQKTGNIINSKLTIFENVLSKKHLIYKNIFEILSFLNAKPDYFEIHTTTFEEDGKCFGKKKILAFNEEGIIIIEYILITPIELLESKVIIHV